MNLLTENAKVGRSIKVKEGLEALRLELIKTFAIGKSIKTSEILAKHQLPTRTMTFLTEIGAVEDHTPSGTSMRDGKRIKWVYTRSGENGPVDSQLASDVLLKEKEANRAYLAQKNGMAHIDRVVGKVTPEKGNQGIVEWLSTELTKEEQVKGYIRADSKVMYQRILDVMKGLNQLKTCIAQLPL